MRKRKLFCEYGPVCYQISIEKECLRRSLRDWREHTPFAKTRAPMTLPVLLKGHTSPILRQLEGVEQQWQQNKAKNLSLALVPMHRLIIAPGEIFSFWQLVGRCTVKQGYLPGLTIAGGVFRADTGGGLCQLANLIHYLVLHSPLEVLELHHHSDALFPDHARRVPFGTGTSVFYKNVDYRFRNTTDQLIQLCLWIEDDILCGELRGARPFPLRYRLLEEDACFLKEEDGYYRFSRVFRRRFDRETGEELPRELLLINHSKVMYDPLLIPPEQILEAMPCL